jgi:Na+-translocating ferredoxin:NAD+ oxidoreductase RnfG subunit
MRRWAALPIAVLCAPLPAFAVRYLEVDQAQRLMFPAATAFVPRRLVMAAELARAIDAANPAPSGGPPRAWVAMQDRQTLGYLYVDDVVGKQLMITYALAIDTAGKISSVEILDYRESHGREIRNPRWRQQFFGKSAADALELNRDIKNISGATLSSRHVTQGIKRLLAIHHATVTGS